MPLTPEDVSNKRFTPVRLREGYDMGEVDQFLDEVETEVTRLTRENDDLRSQLSAQSGASPTAVTAAPEPETPAEPDIEVVPETSADPDIEAVPEPELAVVAEPEAMPEPEAVAEPTPAPVVTAPTEPAETIKVHTVSDASQAAVRLLEIATRNADELVTEARNEAEQIVGGARTVAQRLEAESKSKADKVESDARSRSQMLDSETAERRIELFGDLDVEREKLSVEVENLRSFEREYRSRLKSYFTQQLEALDGDGTLSANQAPAS